MMMASVRCGSRNPLSYLARWAGAHRWLYRLAPGISWTEDRLRRWTANRISLVGIGGLSSLEITIPGRRTGVLRTVALLAVPYPDGHLIVGSNWGRPSHPSWSTNLRAVDTVLVRVGARESRRQVRRIEGDERAAAWQRALDYWPGYQLEHDLAEGREFRLFVLGPPSPRLPAG